PENGGGSMHRPGQCTRCLPLSAELWRQEKGSASASFVVSRYEQIRDRVDLLPHRVAILRSFTVEPLPVLRAAGLTRGIDFAVSLGDFNAYAQEVFDPAPAQFMFPHPTPSSWRSKRAMWLLTCGAIMRI